MLKTLFSGLLFFITISLFSQVTITWEDLQNVTFEERYNEELGMYIKFPDFGASLKDLDEKKVKITGYVIPVDIDAGLYVLSANPFASCFFCGGSGPESVVSLHFMVAPKRFKTDEICTFEGMLQLNDSDIYELNYILNGAKLVRD